MRLPQPARILLPHQPPMVCIDRLLEAGEDRGLCEVRLVEGHTLLDAKGRLEPCGFVKLAAARSNDQESPQLLARNETAPRYSHSTGPSSSTISTG